ncbi:hypothetical protein J3R83DRAFT_8010 [Lanmaoa asiatica]|nr:hypothetical protein J3R83DRAFT_8010 [Lanmaoa asiatica]
MKYLASLALALAVARATLTKRSSPLGIDVSDYQPNIDWTTVVDNGIQFVYIKATEGTSYISPSFSPQYIGATDAGLIRGAYHFAHPDESSGATQATYFLKNGGGWSADGITLPGALDIECLSFLSPLVIRADPQIDNPSGAECYGLTASEMVSWIQDFSNTYEASTGRTTDWWTTCTGNSAAFATNNPLWIADYASTLGALPAGWQYTSFWQYADSGPNPGDADLWNGDYTGLQRYVFSSRLEWHVDSLAHPGSKQDGSRLLKSEIGDIIWPSNASATGYYLLAYHRLVARAGLLGCDMSRLPVNNSYYPLPIGAYGTPPRSPPPLYHLRRPSRSESVDNKEPLATSSVVQEDTDNTKRRRSCEDLLVRHPDLWFSDGSIVLRAENTLFRVHKSLLARHSGFFHDLFALPQPEADAKSSSKHFSEDIEGCQVLRLHDAPEDVANILTALVDGPNFGNNDPADFQVVSGVLRLATKYVVDSLRSKALDHLSVAWPATLKGWDAREDTSRSFELQAGSEGIYPSPIAIINLAREVNAPSLLPSAFYDLSRYSFSQIFDYGESFEEGAWQCPLSPIDMQRLSLGKEASQHAITTLIQSLGSHARTLMAGPANIFSHQHHPSSYGHTHRTCKRDFSELVTLATQHYLFDYQRGCMDPLYVADELGQPLYDLCQPLGTDRLGGSRRSLEQAECQPCANALETWAKKERERMWKMIPLWFRLDCLNDGRLWTEFDRLLPGDWHLPYVRGESMMHAFGANLWPSLVKFPCHRLHCYIFPSIIWV